MLPSLTAAFIVGLLCGAFLPYIPVTIGFLLAVAAVALSVPERLRRLSARRGIVLFGSLLTGVLYWTVFIWAVTATHVPPLNGTDAVRVIGTVVEPLRHARDRAVLVLALSHIEEAGGQRAVDGRLRLTWREPDITVRGGDRIAVVARLRAPSGMMNPGGFDYAAYLERHGIDAVASVSGPGRVTVLPSETGASLWLPWEFIEGWRDRIRDAAVTSLSGSAAGLYLGMIIGEPDYLTPEVRDLFMATGTVHILSISGSHLGLIAVLSYVLIARICRFLPAVWVLAMSRRLTSTRLAAAVTVFPVTFYTLLAGSQVATVRSLVMILVFLLAVWLGRENRLLPALAGAAWLILLSDPRALFDISFQLSFLSVLAIALVVGRGTDTVPPEMETPSLRSRSRRWLRTYLAITGAVTAMTLPLVAYHFNQIAWLGILANLLVIPYAGFFLVPLGLGSALWLLASGSETLPAASINQAVCDVLVEIVDVLAKAPGAEWHVASPAVPAIAAFYLLLVIAWRSDSAIRLRVGAVAMATLLVMWWAWSPRPWSDGETLRVTFLDVGQGDATVIELPDNRTILIDGGAAYDTFDMGRAVVGPFLWDQGIARLDHVIGTHPQLDHVGGLAWTVRKFQVGRYWGNGMRREEPFYQRLQAGLNGQGLNEDVAESGGMIIDSGPCRLRILNPPHTDEMARRVSVNAHSGAMMNNLSVVTRLDCGPHSFLFTADIEAEAIARLQKSDSGFNARIIKVPHHGSRGSLHVSWITKMHPEAAVISVGRANSYGHPASAVLRAYEGEGTRVLRTDRQGAIQITAKLSTPGVDIQAARDMTFKTVRIGEGMFLSELHNLGRLWTGWLGK
ncbi:MAG: DNA internalization-related competence protein ComEC/Rec2 [Nitrospiraceae bacterium]